MDLNELLHVLGRRKLWVVGTVVVALAITLVSLRFQTRIYEAESTVLITPAGGQENPLSVLAALDFITPGIAQAATSHVTLDRSRARLGGALASSVSVRTFERTPIIKVVARDADPRLAQRSAQTVTDVLLERLKSDDVPLSRIVAVSQADSPELPAAPVSPKPALSLIVGSIIGLGFGIGLALLRENLTRRVESAEALSELTGVPCFGEIPEEASVGRLSSPEELASETRLRAVAEAFRDLRTNLQFSEGAFSSVVVTSPEGRHGKTTVAFGLAVTIARSGARALLVDGDLRRGRVAEMLGIPRSPGLVEVLQGQASVEDAVGTTALETLHLLPGGHLIESPGELLEAEFFSFLYRLERLYDVVVIDATPLVPINDARIMARFASCTLLVASVGGVTRRQLRTAVDRLSLISVRPTAVVLNKSRARRRSTYEAYLESPSAERRAR
jgi:receptor protein-tyrosine kinase